MNGLDYAVLLGVILGIAAYGTWRTRRRRDLTSYIHGDRDTPWFIIGISVMATQASAVTFLSTPGQGFDGGLSFVQNYFGAPFALIIISAFFLPIFRRLRVHTAYEYLGRRFDRRARLLAGALFLLQRGMSAGITIYAPAIVLSTVFYWPLSATIVVSGLIVTIYTVTGGCAAVNLTQKYQFTVIVAGMVAAFVILIHRLPAQMHMNDALALAGASGKINPVSFSADPKERYTIWSGIFGGMFLALSYFGADQSQVQRYLSGESLRASRLGLMFNAVFKIPMQFLILLLGVMLFVFYQFERPPMFFDQSRWGVLAAQGAEDQGRELESAFNAAHDRESRLLGDWLRERNSGNVAGAAEALSGAQAARADAAKARADARGLLGESGTNGSKESDYVFITFILSNLPHGLIGLLIAVFFAATLSSKAGELNALGSTTVVDFYQQIWRPDATETQCVAATRWATALWGLIAVGFALSITMAENLIQAQNILASLIYGVPLGMFIAAFFFKQVQARPIFWGALTAQALVLILFAVAEIAYLWYNLIGCIMCVAIAIGLQAIERPGPTGSGAD